MAHGGGVNMHVYLRENGFLNSASQYDLETQPLKACLKTLTELHNFSHSPQGLRGLKQPNHTTYIAA